MTQHNKPIKRIAIFGSHISWDGGVDFLCYLLQSIQKSTHGEVEFYLIVPYPIISKLKSGALYFLNNKFRIGSLFNSKVTIFENKNLKIEKGLGVNKIPFKKVYYNYSKSDLAKQLKKINAEVLFPSIESLGPHFSTPWIGYIPDLQHKHFANHFTADEINARDYKYKNLLDESKVLFVNSQAAHKDLLEYYGSQYSNIVSLPFCPPAPLVPVTTSQENIVREKYKITTPYFIISNQFWKHKSHDTAFKALHHLQTLTSQPITLICTGKPFDDKDPAFIEGLFKLIADLNIQSKIIFTGFIPKEDQLALMYMALAVVQPTLFEGGPGGGSVYNAISYDVPCIISDIEINKEVKGNNILYFKAADEKDLAHKMLNIINHPPERIHDFDTLVELGNQRTNELGVEMLKMIKRAIT